MVRLLVGPAGEPARTSRERVVDLAPDPRGGGHRLGSMRLGEDEFDLRLAAKAADRSKAARQEWPVFEERLRELGYGPRAIARAFSTLSGPGTVAEALEVLKRMSRPESPPIALSFEVTETRGGPTASSYVTITSVERADDGIQVNYEIVAPLSAGSSGPRCEAKDDLGNDYRALGAHFGLTADGSSTDLTDGAEGRARGRLTMPIPPSAATMLRIRITCDASVSSIWEGSAHEICVSLPD